jgi:DnaA-homolog protein
MQQLPLLIDTRSAQCFESFIAGQNTLALDYLSQTPAHSPPVFLWGESGTGKSHLLHALADQTQAQGAAVRWFGPDTCEPWVFDETAAWLIFDDCHQFTPCQQQAAFSLFVQASTAGMSVVGAASVPPVDLPLREDLRTRLGWGHVFALKPLTQAQMCTALQCESDRRGLFLPNEVVHYLMTRFDRNLKALMHLLNRLDTFALVHQRALTIPLLKKMLLEMPVHS